LAAEIEPVPWNAESGGIAAFDVSLDAEGSVVSVEPVQDLAPYDAQLGAVLPSWRFEPARELGRSVPSHVLVLGFFRPPFTIFAAPEHPRYKDTVAPDVIPWPTAVVVPPYPPNALGSGAVVLEADVSDAGAVTNVRIASRPTPFDDAAQDTALHWTFRPARRGGQAVASRAFLVLSFFGTTP
jgi:TonB family protein